MGAEHRRGQEYQKPKVQLLFEEIFLPEGSESRCWDITTDKGESFGTAYTTGEYRTVLYPGMVDIGQLGRVASELSQLANGKELDFTKKEDRSGVNVYIPTGEQRTVQLKCGDKDCGIGYKSIVIRGNLGDEPVFADYTKALQKSDKIDFIRMDIKDPSNDDDTGFTFTADRNIPEYGNELAISVHKWNDGLMKWVINTHDLKDQLGKVDKEKTAQKLNEL